jgi:predicted DNA-binding transcriptional regulator YafY
MYDPVMRVLTVLEILQAREQVSGSELAERLEVDLRTVQRYITRLQDLSIPVESVRGVGGHYRLKPGFRLPPLMFTEEEAFAVALGLRALRHLGLAAFAPATEGASAKLGRVLPGSLRDSVRTVDEVVALEPGPWTVSTSAESLIRVAIAIRARRLLAFHYLAHSGATSQRHVEPYGVLHMDGRWYVVGRCLMRQALRTFRLDRITELRQQDGTFERPADFDIRAYINKAMPFVQSKYQVEVWLDLPIQEVQKHVAPWRITATEENGGTVLTCGRDELTYFAAMLLAFGCRIVVRRPLELREMFARMAMLASRASS